jgi:hypothetical protein
MVHAAMGLRRAVADTNGTPAADFVHLSIRKDVSGKAQFSIHTTQKESHNTATIAG